MIRFPITRLLVMLAMLLSIAGGPAVASAADCRAGAKLCAARPGKSCCCHGMACCAMKGCAPAHEVPAPVQQPVGHDLAAMVAAAPFSVLFTFGPTEAKRAPRALFADGHSPVPIAASCIWMI